MSLVPLTPAELAELGSRERRLRGVREAAAGLLCALDGTDKRVGVETRIAVLRAALKATEDLG